MNNCHEQHSRTTIQTRTWSRTWIMWIHWIVDPGCRVLNPRSRIQDPWLSIQDLESKNQDPGSRDLYGSVWHCVCLIAQGQHTNSDGFKDAEQVRFCSKLKSVFFMGSPSRHTKDKSTRPTYKSRHIKYKSRHPKCKSRHQKYKSKHPEYSY